MYKIENITNKIFQDDNIKILKCIPENSIDLVYLDPPFFSQTNWEKNGNKFEDKWKDMNEYIEFMSIRLIELRRVLKPTGSIYLHCDSSASHYLKIEMDKIFGYDNIINEIVWAYKSGGIPKNAFARKHDTIFIYSKTKDYKFNQQFGERDISELKKYPFVDERGHYGYYKLGGKKNYFEEVRMRDVWEISILNQMSKERLGYPTQKPEKLLERIIKASSNSSDIILDPFCGSGTTCAVAKKLGRKYIGIDKSQEAVKMTEERLKEIYIAKSLFDCEIDI